MTSIAAAASAPAVSYQRTARTAGAFYLLTFVSIPTLALYAAALDPSFVTSSGSDLPIRIGALLDVIVALANVGTAVVLFPIIKRRNEAVALGFVTARVLESSAMIAGVACLLALVSLRESGAGSDGLAAAHALVLLYTWLRLAQGLFPAINALLLGWLLFTTRLVPRWIPTVGLIGAPLLMISVLATLLGVWPQSSGPAAIAALPIAIWEFSLGLTLVIKGVRTARIPN